MRAFTAVKSLDLPVLFVGIRRPQTGFGTSASGKPATHAISDKPRTSQNQKRGKCDAAKRHWRHPAIEAYPSAFRIKCEDASIAIRCRAQAHHTSIQSAGQRNGNSPPDKIRRRAY